jgi:hypothetical protein
MFTHSLETKIRFEIFLKIKKLHLGKNEALLLITKKAQLFLSKEDY